MAANARRNDGTGLERRFAKWLEGWNFFDRVELRQRVRGQISVEVYEVDVLAARHNKKWVRIQNAIVYASACGLVLGMCILNVIAPISGWEVLPVLAFVSLGLWMAKKAEERVNVGVWAECKDTKDSVSRETVAILKHHVDDVRSKAYGWKPTIVYLVTSGRFDSNAIRLADAYGFICLEERDNEFQEAVSPVT